MRRNLPRAWLSILAFVTLVIPAHATGSAHSTGSGLGAAQARSAASSISTDAIFQAIGLADGTTVCEIGAGDGELAVAAGKVVGSGGRVYATELGEERVKTLRQKIESSGLTQITVLAGDPAKTNFPDAACDAVFMRNVYHHFADPAAMNASIAAALKPGGRLAVIDFTPSGDEASTPADRGKDGMHGIKPETLSRELKEAGFQALSSEAGAQRWFMVVVTKPASLDTDGGAPEHTRSQR